MSPCWPNSNVGCFACGNHECISRRLNSKYAGKRKNAMRMAPTGLHFQRSGSLNPVTYLSGQINERDCTEKAINQFVLLLDRLQLPAMHRRCGGGGSRFVSPAVFQPRFMARQRRKICGSNAMEA
ncbi:hypothetical protein ALC62_11738 [Cyphomyrmex costatus]|uniref:Uncharacterized protein n=1 Tax=Cyphomyrmex costatus TaxID=456900 RepID=A0A195CB68_9HYME|nr:hypothetical protein ALC62_11738 [Cyphomyrmex costatus]